MRHILLITVLLSIMIACIIPLRKPSVHLPISTVKVIINETTHGSGTHIGGGLILTANHVVGDKTNLTIKTDDGTVYDAAVQWTSPLYDVALIRVTEKPLLAAKSYMDCSVLATGTAVMARGNPAGEEFVTTWGRVSAKAKSNDVWKESWLVNMTVIPGMSGGGVFDKRDRLVGMSVGVMLSGSAFSQSQVGLGYIVPASVICGLLGR